MEEAVIMEDRREEAREKCLPFLLPSQISCRCPPPRPSLGRPVKPESKGAAYRGLGGG